MLVRAPALAFTLSLVAAPAALAAPFAYIANLGSDNVSVIDLATRTVVKTLTVGSQPYGVAVAPSGSPVLVTNSASNTVSVIDGTTNTVTGIPIPVGIDPRGVAISADGSVAAVANYGSNNVTFIDMATRSALGTPVAVGTGPFGVAFEPDGKRLLVTNNGANSVSVVTVATRTVAGPELAVGVNPKGIAVSPIGGTAWTLNGYTFSAIDLATLTVTTQFRSTDTFCYCSPTLGVAAAPAGTSAYMAGRQGYAYFGEIVSVGPLADVQSRFGDTARSNEGISLDPSGSFAYVTSPYTLTDPGQVFVIDLASGHRVSTIDVGLSPLSLGQFIQPAPLPRRIGVTRTGSGTGTVASTPGGMSCARNCEAGFPAGTTVTLAATPAAGSVFTGWSGGLCTGTGPCTVTLDASKTVTATFTLATDVPRLVNLSTRARIASGDNVLIAGFIVGGTAPKSVLVRARGPSLLQAGVANSLADPVLTLYTGANLIALNDDWGNGPSSAAIQASGMAPPKAAESAILATLAPGAYTAIVSSYGNAPGIGLVEAFEMDHPETQLMNISSRGQVLAGEEVMISGFVVSGATPRQVVVRARGPSLAAFGIANALQNPVLQVYSGSTLVAMNDDWGTAANAAALSALGFAPSDPREAALLLTLPPGPYTAIVTGAGGTTGVGIVEVFAP